MKKNLTPDQRERNRLAKLIRSGKATPEQEIAYETLDKKILADWNAANPPGPAPRSIWDLPVAKAMFEADRRDFQK